MPKLENRAYTAIPEADQTRELCAVFLALQAQAQANQGLRDELSAIKHSNSWRLTAPLRRLRNWLRPPSAPQVAPLQPAMKSSADLVLPDPSELLHRRAAVAANATRVAPSRRQLLVDVTELARENLGAGVQRVVYRIFAELLIEPPHGFRVEPVRLSDDGRYVYARGFLARMLGLPPSGAGADVPVTFEAGDQLLGLDLIRDRAGLARPVLQAMRAKGVGISFVVFDLLPLQHPEWFPPGVAARFEEWLRLVTDCGDRAFCISDVVREDMRSLVEGRGLGSTMMLASFPLGADLDGWLPPTAGMPPIEAGSARLLMVGTLERRKGHAQALDAFELLWAGGERCELAIVGRVGWLVPGLVDRISGHPELGKRLHWIDGGDDATLLGAYRESTGLLAPSWGEGFGLPLVEAAAQGLPILARDLPVFRAVAGEGADYFLGGSGEELASAIQDWLQRWREGRLADSKAVMQRSWRDSADVLKRLLSGA